MKNNVHEVSVMLDVEQYKRPSKITPLIKNDCKDVDGGWAWIILFAFTASNIVAAGKNRMVGLGFLLNF